MLSSISRDAHNYSPFQRFALASCLPTRETMPDDEEIEERDGLKRGVSAILEKLDEVDRRQQRGNKEILEKLSDVDAREERNYRALSTRMTGVEARTERLEKHIESESERRIRISSQPPADASTPAVTLPAIEMRPRGRWILHRPESRTPLLVLVLLSMAAFAAVVWSRLR
jgi:hypothetical protein